VWKGNFGSSRYINKPICRGHRDNTRRDEPQEPVPGETFELLIAKRAPYSGSAQAVHSPVAECQSLDEAPRVR